MLMTSCCDRECGESVWKTYLEHERDINEDMQKLMPERQPYVLSSYIDTLDRMSNKHPYTSEYRMVRDARERRLLWAKRRYVSVQRDIDLDRCYCLYNAGLEKEVREGMR